MATVKFGDELRHTVTEHAACGGVSMFNIKAKN